MPKLKIGLHLNHASLKPAPVKVLIRRGKKKSRQIQITAEKSLANQAGDDSLIFSIDKDSRELFENPPPGKIVLRPTDQVTLLLKEEVDIKSRKGSQPFPHLPNNADKPSNIFTLTAGLVFTKPKRPAHDHADMHIEC